MKFLAWFTGLVLLLAAACSDKAPPHVTPVPVAKKPGPAPLPAPAPVPALVPEPASTANPAPADSVPHYDKIQDRLPTAPPNFSRIHPASIDRKMTEALHQYYEAKGRMPPDFNALVTAGVLKQVPSAPPGKKFAVDRPNLHVVIVDP